MEVERQTMRSRQLRSRDMLRGDLEGEDLERYVEERVVMTNFDKMLNWGRANSCFPLTFGLACCAIEAPISIVTARYDLARFGAEALRASPRQADLIIVAGTVTYKMATRIKMLYDQMPDPKYVISMGSCSNCGGLFQLAYSVLKGIDQVIPVDVYVPGCPPRPEALLEGIMTVQKRMQQEHGWLRKLWNRKGSPSIKPARTTG